MELSHEEVEEYLLKIFTGQNIVVLECDGLDVKLLFKQPDNFTKLKANNIYKESYDMAVKEGLLPKEELEQLIIDRGLFTEEDQEKIDKLESKLYAQRVLLGKTTKVKARQDRLKEIIKDIEAELIEVKLKKYSKLMMSAETKAEEDRSSFLCWSCTYNEEDELYWAIYHDLLRETNLSFRQTVINNFLKFYSGISTDVIRYIARSNLWRIRYVTSSKVADPLFGVPTSEYTNDMVNLAYWSNFYQSVYEMMPDDRPPDSIIEDNESLDAYMKDYYEERNREDAAKRSRSTTSGKLSAFDKEEVIVTQSNELYEDIKYDKPREAQRIKDRSDIKKRTRRPS